MIMIILEIGTIKFWKVIIDELMITTVDNYDGKQSATFTAHGKARTRTIGINFPNTKLSLHYKLKW